MVTAASENIFVRNNCLYCGEEFDCENILTETDAPFTFDSKINNRLDSLKNAIQEIALIKRLSEGGTKEKIYKNFKTLLECN